MKSSPMQGKTCDLFCTVVDNYGDIGVAWRLARQLAVEYGLRIRLWLDGLGALQRIWPSAQLHCASQWQDGIEVRQWDASFPEVEPAELIIEAFGCPLPENFLAAMARREPKPIWINLEYLSAEAWVKGCHGLPSPHPRLSLTAYFFYPGFEPETGGLIREADLLARRDAQQESPDEQACLWQSLGIARPDEGALTVSLFSYDHAAIPELLAAWADGDRAICCLVPDGVATEGLARFIGGEAKVGQSLRRGQLKLRIVPFIDQSSYDRLLWACDFNFVRGEDSFVRAQWAGLPMAWNIYPQEADAHLVKLRAFLDLYCQGLSTEAAGAYRAFTEAWNRNRGVREAWPSLVSCLPELRRHARTWSEHLAGMPDLATKLMLFCQKKL